MAILTDAFSTVLRLSLQVLPVLAVVLAVRAVLLRRSSRRVAFILWAVVGFRLLCPAALYALGGVAELGHHCLLVSVQVQLQQQFPHLRRRVQFLHRGLPGRLQAPSPFHPHQDAGKKRTHRLCPASGETLDEPGHRHPLQAHRLRHPLQGCLQACQQLQLPPVLPHQVQLYRPGGTQQQKTSRSLQHGRSSVS